MGLKGWESQSDVRRAFLQRALQYHPDKRTTEATNDEAFNLFVTAYKTLYDPGLRAQYDSSLQKKNTPSTRDNEPRTAIEGNELFRRMDAARRHLRVGAGTVYSNKNSIEKQFGLKSGSLRFDEGVPCNGESCSQAPHTLFRVTDPKLVGSLEKFVFVCLKHKYLHYCSKDCYTIKEVCPIFAWYLVARYHRRITKKIIGKKKIEIKCTKETCAPKKGDESRGFIRLGKNIFTCKQHTNLHLCDESSNDFCEFTEDWTGHEIGECICWATKRQFFSPHYALHVSKPVPTDEACNLHGRRRILEDGTSIVVPWGLDIGEAIPEYENSGTADIASNLQNRFEEEKKQKKLLDKELDYEAINPHDSIYQQYIGVLRNATLNQDRLGDYLTMHHGRMGGDEGGTGFEGMEDDLEEEAQEQDQQKETFSDFLISEKEALKIDMK